MRWAVDSFGLSPSANILTINFKFGRYYLEKKYKHKNSKVTYERVRCHIH